MVVAQVAYNVESIAGFLLVDILQTVYVARTETTAGDTCTEKGTKSLVSLLCPRR